MSMTYMEHERKMKAPAVCELLPLRDLPLGDDIMVRTNGAFVAGYQPVFLCDSLTLVHAR